VVATEAAFVKVPAVPDTPTEFPVVVPLPTPAVRAVKVIVVPDVVAVAKVLAAEFAVLYRPVLGAA
jgi:hypothetical protein